MGKKDKDYDDYGFGDDYEETTVDPGIGPIVACLVVSGLVMFVVMPIFVYLQKRRKRIAKVQKEISMMELKATGAPDGSYQFVSENAEPSNEDEFRSSYKKVRTSFKTIFRMDRESKRILRYALPFTVSEFTSAVLESTVLALIGHYVGTKQLAAVAISEILMSLVEDVLQGPLGATTTLCAHAVGAENWFLAGQYVQLSLIFYSCLQIPFLFVWCFLTDDILLWLGWGDEVEAQYALEYVRIIIISVVLDCVHGGFSSLLEVTGHEYYTTLVGIIQEASVVVILVIMHVVDVQLDLKIVAWIYVLCSGFFLVLTLGLAFWVGWLTPFAKGIFRNFSLKNSKAVNNMIKTSIPLSFGSVLGNAEWAVLTVFASHMGIAEVAAWAILGSIWDIFESTTSGIGDAAEIRVSYHLGNNHPSKAKLSAYKSLFLGTLLAFIVSCVMFILINQIPEWFTLDETLQGMIAECLPLIGVGNIIMSFGILCWYMIGAQGRYKLGTWIHFGTSWGITMPLAALSVYVWNFDLQALTFSVVISYVGVGATLAYVLLTSDWAYHARKIQRQMAEEEEESKHDEGGDAESDDAAEELYAALQARRSRAARATATGNLKLVTAPAGPIGIGIDMLPHRKGPTITTVLLTSPFHGKVFPGDSLLSVDRTNVLSLSLDRIYDLMKPREDDEDRQITVMMATPCHYQEEETSDVLLSGSVPDIPDFEEAEGIYLPSWWDDDVVQQEQNVSVL